MAQLIERSEILGPDTGPVFWGICMNDITKKILNPNAVRKYSQPVRRIISPNYFVADETMSLMNTNPHPPIPLNPPSPKILMLEYCGEMITRPILGSSGTLSFKNKQTH